MAANDEMKRLDTVVISGSGASAVVGRVDIVSDVPSGGTIDITENGVYDVTEYSEADVQVEGLVPTGTKSITANGEHDVTEYATANVNVPASAVVSGTKSITSNGTVDVTNYASANVNVPASAVVSGTKSITANGTVDVTNYASANVNVPITAPEYGTITFTNGTSDTIRIYYPVVGTNSGASYGYLNRRVMVLNAQETRSIEVSTYYESSVHTIYTTLRMQTPRTMVLKSSTLFKIIGYNDNIDNLMRVYAVDINLSGNNKSQTWSYTIEEEAADS